MTNKTRTLLFVFISLAILGVMVYGYFSTKKLDEHKEAAVESNIKDFLYDETKDTIDLEAEEEDLDGDDVIDEEDDFEVYEEDGLWEEDNEKSKAQDPVAGSTKPGNELEELYDKKPKPENTKIATKPITEGKSSPTTTTTNPIAATTGNFLVVVGSFKSKQNAGKKKKALEKAGITGEIIQLKESALHLVIAGRFSTETEAEAFKNELTTENGLKAFVKEVAE